MQFPVRDYSSIGVNNLNQLVTHQLGASGFEVVRTIYDNIQWLNHLFNNLGSLQQVENQLYVLKGLETYLGDIVNVSQHLRTIIDLHRDLPLVNELAPRINKFTSELEEVNCKLSKQDGKVNELTGLVQSSLKSFNDLYANHVNSFNEFTSNIQNELRSDYQEFKKDLCIERTQAIKLYDEIKDFIPILNSAIDNQNRTTKLLVHLNASDIVTLAIHTKNEVDYASALKAIKESESYGNNEDLNRSRLNYKLTDNNVFNIMNTAETLTKEGNCE